MGQRLNRTTGPRSRVVRVQVPQLAPDILPVAAAGIEQKDQIRVGGAHELEHLLRRAVLGEHVHAHHAQRNAAERGARRAAQPQVLDRQAVHDRDGGKDGGAAMRPDGQGKEPQDHGRQDVLQPEMAEQVECPPQPGRQGEHGDQRQPRGGEHQEEVQGALSLRHVVHS